MRKKYLQSGMGLTLIEIIITMAILTGLLVGLLNVFIYCFDLQETSRNTAIVLNQARAKIEEIRNTGFSAIVATYNGNVSSLTTPYGKIRTEAINVPGSNGNLIDIRVLACWRQKGGRIIGNATFTAGNMTNCLASPVELVTAISNRQ